MTRAHYKVRVCNDQVYSVDEMCAVYKVHRNAVTNWLKSGLRLSDDQRPYCVRGAELNRFHDSQRSKPRAKLKQGEMNCLACDSAIFPEVITLSIHTLVSGALMAKARCPTCDAHVTKFLNVTECDNLKNCIMTGRHLASIHEGKLTAPADTGNKSASRGPETHSTNDRVVHQWQEYAGRFEESTRRKHLHSIRFFENFIGGKAFEKVKSKEAASFRDHLVRLGRTPQEEGGLSRSTIRHHASQVRQFFDWLRNQDGYKRLSSNICLNLELPKASRAKTLPREDNDYLTIVEAEEMLLAMPDATIDERRDRAMVATLFCTGLRASALTSLRREDITLETKEVCQDGTRLRAKNGKNYRMNFFARTDLFQEILMQWMWDLQASGFTDEDALFPDLKYLPSRPSNIGRIEPMTSNGALTTAFEKAVALVNRQCTPHSARDTIKALGDEICKTPRERRVWSMALGHSSERTTEVYYGKPSGDERREIMEGLSRESHLTADEMAMILDFYEHRFPRGSTEHATAERLANRRIKARDGIQELK